MASTVWRGFITFGLISIPVRLFRAARAERVSFRRVHAVSPAPAPEPEQEVEPPPPRAKKGAPRAEALPFPSAAAARAEQPPYPVFAPVQQASIRNDTGDLLPQNSVTKGYEYEKGRFLAIEAEELKSIAPKTATEMQIEEFVRLDEIDPVYFETSYYVVPEEAGEKAYALLYRAMQTSSLVAIAQFAMHNREHVVVIRSAKKGIVAHTMFFSSEVRAEEEFRTDVTKVSAKELQLAQTLIESLAASFEPDKYHDTYREKVEALIAKKIAGRPVSFIEAPRSAPVVDITEALQKSLAALKKPAASEQRPTKQPASGSQKRKRGHA
jgi:DNA end-binding protein Ku